MRKEMKVPCAYQGGKQRIATQIVDILLSSAKNSDVYFYDLCCGSAAISIELVNRGVAPSKIRMLDISSWGVFWSAIGSGTFNKVIFEQYLSDLPRDKHYFKSHMSALSALPIGKHEAELYPILQANSFGGKQIWRNGNIWENACFRSYWEPTATSIRRSPANPMQPSPLELQRRINELMIGMKGITCFNKDIRAILNTSIPNNSVVYIDPPYKNTTGYAFSFEVTTFIKSFLKINHVPLFVSEGYPLSDNSIKLKVHGANGGISGTRKEKHQEWLSQF